MNQIMSTVTLSASNFSDVVYTNVLQRTDNLRLLCCLAGSILCCVLPSALP